MSGQPPPEPAPAAPDAEPSGPTGPPASGWTAPPPPPERPGSMLRWIVVAVVAILIAALLGTVVWFAAQRPAGAPAYLPADTAAYAELRLDLTGGQADRAADFLGHFPGFADRATLEAKLDDALDRLVGEMTERRYSYTGDLKPWFNGQLALALAVPPDEEAAEPGSAEPEALWVIGVRDRAAARTVVERVLAEGEEAERPAYRTEEYRGATIWSREPGAPRAEPPGLPSPLGDLPIPLPEPGRGGRPDGGLALTDDALLLGTHLEAVRAALDRRAGAAPRLSDAPAFGDAISGLRQDRIGLFWFSGEQLRRLLEHSAGPLPLPTPVATASPPGGELPEQVVGTLHLESDRIVAEVWAEPPGRDEPPTPHESGLAGRVPAGTLVYIEVHAFGGTIGEAIAGLKAQPGFAEEGGPELEQFEALLGARFEEYLDWVGDTAIAGWLEEDEPTAGLVATVIDSDAAEARLRQLGALLRLGGLATDAPIRVDDEEHAGTMITTLTVEAGAAALMELPEGFSVSWAATDELFVLSPDPDFVRSVLDGPPADSLADSERFRAGLALVGGPATTGLSYVDLAGVRAAVGETLPVPERDRYEREIEPYLEPFDVLIAAGVADGERLVSRTVLTVAETRSQE